MMTEFTDMVIDDTEKLKIITIDGNTIEMEKTFLDLFKTLKHCVNDFEIDFGQPELFVETTSLTFYRLLEFAKEYRKHQVDSMAFDDNYLLSCLDKFDQDHEALKEFTIAADWCQFEECLDLCASKFALILAFKGTTPDVARNLFGYKDDLDNNTKIQLAKDNAWTEQLSSDYVKS